MKTLFNKKYYLTIANQISWSKHGGSKEKEKQL